MRPGITGWAQVNGRNFLPFSKRFELDVWYVDHCSFMLDLKIVCLSIHRGLFRKDILISDNTQIIDVGYRIKKENSFDQEEEVESTAGAHKPRTDQDWMKLAFYPFTMPLTLGPGAIAVTTAIGTSMNFTIPNVIGAFAAALANALIVWLCFRYADRITEILGSSGSDAIGRIFSFILVCLGVQIFWTGFSELWLTLVSSVPK